MCLGTEKVNNALCPKLYYNCIPNEIRRRSIKDQMTEPTPVKEEEARSGFCAGFDEHNNDGL